MMGQGGKAGGGEAARPETPVNDLGQCQSAASHADFTLLLLHNPSSALFGRNSAQMLAVVNALSRRWPRVARSFTPGRSLISSRGLPSKTQLFPKKQKRPAQPTTADQPTAFQSSTPHPSNVCVCPSLPVRAAYLLKTACR